MRKLYMGLSVGLVASLLFLAACDSGSKIQTEDEICRAVFETIQNGDAATFNSYCISTEKLTMLTEVHDSDSPKDKDLKAELAGEDITRMTDSTTNFYKKTQSKAAANKLDLKTATYEGIVNSEVRVKLSTFTAVRTEFKISFDDHLYYVRLDVMQTPETIIVYDAKLLDYGKVEMSIVEPKENPLVFNEGEEISVQLQFDAVTANKYEGWLQPLFDGNIAGVEAAAALESPYKYDIPLNRLTVGKHAMTFRIHPGRQQVLFNGGEQDYRVLGEVTLEIEVK